MAYRLDRTLLILFLLCHGCTFGSKGNQNEEDSTALALIVGSLRANAEIKLRFFDKESNATLSSFTSGANAIVLQSPGEIEIEKLEIWTEPDLLAGIFPWRKFIPVSELAAHEQHADTSTTAQKTIFFQNIILRDFFLTTSGTDGLSRPYFALPTLNVSNIPPGRISRIVLHVKRVNLTGTFNATTFTVAVSTPIDSAVVPTCATTASLSRQARIFPIFNFKNLFSGATSANSAHLEAKFIENLRSTHALEEHFITSCDNLQ